MFLKEDGDVVCKSKRNGRLKNIVIREKEKYVRKYYFCDKE